MNKPGDTINLSKDLFIKNYYDKQGDKPYDILFLNNTKYGLLTLNDKIIYENDIIKYEELDNIVYTRISSLEYTEVIQYKIGDNNLNKKYSNMATFTINVNQYINQKPDQIGDNDITLNNGQSYVFTVEDFTTNTIPPYDDPEGDSPYKLKITKMPTDGSKIALDNTLLVLNSEVLFTDIALGKLSIIPSPNINQHSLDFEFDISDVGSQQYSGL